jgi:hypothetical protein
MFSYVAILLYILAAFCLHERSTLFEKSTKLFSSVYCVWYSLKLLYFLPFRLLVAPSRLRRNFILPECVLHIFFGIVTSYALQFHIPYTHTHTHTHIYIYIYIFLLIDPPLYVFLLCLKYSNPFPRTFPDKPMAQYMITIMYLVQCPA